MTVTKNDADYMNAPKDYADLFKQYYPHVVNFCGYLGINENNAEDAASDILMRFLERESLEKFDPELNFNYMGTERKARFKNFLFRSVDLYSRGHRDRQTKLARRELQICDVTTTGANNPQRATSVDSSSGGTSSAWVDVYGESHQDHADGVHDMIDEEADAHIVRTLLGQVPPRSTYDRCDLVALYDAVRVQVLAYGEYDIKVLKDKFGVSTTAMHTWMWWLKENLAHIYGYPMPAKRPRRTRPRDEQQ